MIMMMIMMMMMQPPPQARRFSQGGDEPQGTMGRVQTAGEAPYRP